MPLLLGLASDIWILVNQTGAYTVLSTKSVSSLLSLTFYKMFT
jgi:hypothetical protein